MVSPELSSLSPLFFFHVAPTNLMFKAPWVAHSFSILAASLSTTAGRRKTQRSRPLTALGNITFHTQPAPPLHSPPNPNRATPLKSAQSTPTSPPWTMTAALSYPRYSLPEPDDL